MTTLQGDLRGAEQIYDTLYRVRNLDWLNWLSSRY